MRAVLFDLDGTLHDRAATVRSWLTGHIERHALPAGYAERFTVLDDLGYRPKREVMPLLVHELALAHDPQVLLDDFMAHSLIAPVPMPHAHDVLRELRRCGVRVGVVTNGGVEAQTACLERTGFASLVDDVVISEGVGLSKPDPAIYALALARLGVGPADAWFVGDSPRNDVWGPQHTRGLPSHRARAEGGGARRGTGRSAEHTKSCTFGREVNHIWHETLEI